MCIKLVIWKKFYTMVHGQKNITIGLHVKYTLLLSQFNHSWTFLTDLRQIIKYPISWNPTGDEGQTNRRNDTYDEANSHFSQFSEPAKNWEKEEGISIRSVITSRYRRLQCNYEGCPESVQPFLMSREPIAWTWCNLEASQRRPYCASMNSHCPVGLVSRQWDAVDWTCVLCDRHIYKFPLFQRRF